jgi:diaminopimelate decarboxylase
VKVVGLGAHIGSTLKSVGVYVDSARSVCRAALERLRSGKTLEFVDFGGGFQIDYGAGPVPRPAEFVAAARRLAEREGLGSLSIVVEPGRSVVGPHGVLVASVVQEKRTPTRRWAFLDAAMNDLIRPALYGARHRIEPIDRAPSEPSAHVAGLPCPSASSFATQARTASRWLARTTAARCPPKCSPKTAPSNTSAQALDVTLG